MKTNTQLLVEEYRKAWGDNEALPLRAFAERLRTVWPGGLAVSHTTIANWTSGAGTPDLPILLLAATVGDRRKPEIQFACDLLAALRPDYSPVSKIAKTILKK